MKAGNPVYVTTFGMPIGMAASFDTNVIRQISEVLGVESRALSQRDYLQSFDNATGLRGVGLSSLVCKDAANVNMMRSPLWGRNPETYGEVSEQAHPHTHARELSNAAAATAQIVLNAFSHTFVLSVERSASAEFCIAAFRIRTSQRLWVQLSPNSCSNPT